MRKIDETVWEVVKHRCADARFMVKGGHPQVAKWELGYAQGVVMSLAQEERSAMLGHIGRVDQRLSKAWDEIETALDYYHRALQEQDHDKLAAGILRDVRSQREAEGHPNVLRENGPDGTLTGGGDGDVHTGDGCKDGQADECGG